MSGEEMLQCPYNYSHVILKSRMASHLQKCREQFPLENYTTCPFNATHDVPIPELKYHTDTCPDRKTMENYLYVIDDKKEEEEESNLVEIQTSFLEENWDEEKISGSYLEAKDKVKVEQKLLKPPVGKSKSEKKAFSQSQVQKFQKADEKLKVEKIKTGSSQLLMGICEKEGKPSETEPGMAKSSNEEEDFKEVVRRTKKIGLSRGSIIREKHLKKDNV